MSTETESDVLDLGEALGASDATSTQVLTVYMEYLHRLGRETNQGEVGVEFDGNFYRITEFD